MLIGLVLLVEAAGVWAVWFLLGPESRWGRRMMLVGGMVTGPLSTLASALYLLLLVF